MQGIQPFGWGGMVWLLGCISFEFDAEQLQTSTLLLSTKSSNKQKSTQMYLIDTNVAWQKENKMNKDFCMTKSKGSQL